MSLGAELEKAFAILLQPSGDSQVEGFKNLQTLLKSPGTEAGLCECMIKSQSAVIRRYSSIVLRRKFVKPKQWKQCPPDIKQGVKQASLQAFLSDSDKPCQSSFAHLIAVIANHELPKEQWPELMDIINQSLTDCNSLKKEMGLFALSVIAQRMGKALKPHYKSLLVLFSLTLVDTSNPEIPFYTIQTMENMVQGIGTEEIGFFQALIPTTLTVIKNFAESDDEEKAVEAMAVFEELLDTEVAVIVPYIKPILLLCLEFADDGKYGDALRIKALNLIRYIIEMKKKTILKQKLVKTILDVVFPLMSKPSHVDIDEVDDEQSLPSVAAQTLDAMALHFPPEKLIPHLMPFFEPALQSPDPYHRKSAYLGLAVIAEGCSEHIRHKYLPAYIEVICKGIKDQNSVVRNAALYSLGQYAEYLQPDISKYASEVLPLLFEYLNQAYMLLQQENANISSLKKVFYAVETFCENLEEGFLPFLPALMSCLMAFLSFDGPKSEGVKELTVRSIGSVATAAKENFAPFFASVMNKLKDFVAVQAIEDHNKQSEEKLALQVQSIEALALIARHIGTETFLPVATDCVKLGVLLVETFDEPDLRRAVYNMYGAVSTVLKSDMILYLTPLVERMVLSITSSQGVEPKFLDAAPTFSLFDEENLDDDDDDDDDDMENDDPDENREMNGDIVGFTVDNDFMDEKESACYALKDFANELGRHFVPYITNCFNEILKHIDNPASDVRRAAVFTLAQFVITYGKAFDETGSVEHKSALEMKLSILLPKLYCLTREDTDRRVVLACLEALEDLLNHLNTKALTPGTVEHIMQLVKEVYLHKLGCQDASEDEDDSEDAEYDSMLMEYAGELVACLVKIVPSAEFALQLKEILPFFYLKARVQSSTSDKSFSIGTLADIVSNMEKNACSPYYPQLELAFLNGLKDESGEVRSNAVYGLGVLIANAGSICYEHYPIFLRNFSEMLTKEDFPRAMDNLCAAMARMILTNVDAVPMNMVFPYFIQCLPLKDDIDENETVFTCLSYLHSIRCEELFQNLPQVLKILAEVLASQKINTQTLNVIVKLVKDVQSEFPAEFENVHVTLPPAFQDAFAKVMEMTLPCDLEGDKIRPRHL